MAERGLRPQGPTIAAIILLLLGGIATFWTVAWWVERSYLVTVSAPDGLSWTMWLPHQTVPMTWTTDGNARVVGVVETPYGARLNVTGPGTARIRFAFPVIGFGEKPWDLGPHVNLTRQEGGRPGGDYRVWRQTSDSSANVSVNGIILERAYRLGEDWQCGGPGYFDYPQEGWSQVRPLLGDCVAMIFLFPGIVPAALRVPGMILAVVAHRRGVRA